MEEPPLPRQGHGATRGFAGEDPEAAKHYPEDREFLLEFEPRVVHYRVVGQARRPSSSP